MNKLLGILVLGLLLSSTAIAKDTDGRWRGLVSYEWDPFLRIITCQAFPHLRIVAMYPF